jgi:hypothetical protein
MSAEKSPRITRSNVARSGLGRLNLIAIAAIAALPLGGSYLLYFLWTPTAFVNYGELVGPIPLAEMQASTAPELKGKWVFLMVDSGRCDDYCERKLYAMRQVRLTQGKDMERIERAWLLDDGTAPAASTLDEYKGTRLLAMNPALLRKLPAIGSVRDHIYLVDPLGNVMMRYPRDADPNRMKKDLARLLRASRIG